MHLGTPEPPRIKNRQEPRRSRTHLGAPPVQPPKDPRQGLPAHRETHSRMRKHGFTNSSNASGTPPRMILGSNGRHIAQAARSGTLCSRSRPASRKSTYLKTCLPPFGRGSRRPPQQTSFTTVRSKGTAIGSGLQRHPRPNSHATGEEFEIQK